MTALPLCDLALALPELVLPALELLPSGAQVLPLRLKRELGHPDLGAAVVRRAHLASNDVQIVQPLVVPVTIAPLAPRCGSR